MTTIWGCLERIVKDLPESRWVQVRTVMPGNVAIRTRIFVDEKTLIARGIEQVALSNLREGEFVEVTFRPARTGLVKADTIYAQREPVMSESNPSSSVPTQTSSQSSMQQGHAVRNQSAASQANGARTPVPGTLSDVFFDFDRATLRLEARATLETNARLL